MPLSLRRDVGLNLRNGSKCLLLSGLVISRRGKHEGLIQTFSFQAPFACSFPAQSSLWLPARTERAQRRWAAPCSPSEPPCVSSTTEKLSMLQRQKLLFKGWRPGANPASLHRGCFQTRTYPSVAGGIQSVVTSHQIRTL